MKNFSIQRVLITLTLILVFAFAVNTVPVLLQKTGFYEQKTRVDDSELRHQMDVQRNFQNQILSKTQEINQIRTEYEEKINALNTQYKQELAAEKSKNITPENSSISSPFLKAATNTSISIVSVITNKDMNTCKTDEINSISAWLRFVEFYKSNTLSTIDETSLDIRHELQQWLGDLNKFNKVHLASAKSLTEDLLTQYAIITQTPQWKNKFDAIPSDKRGYQLIDTIYEAGFPRSDSSCFNSKHGFSITTADRHLSTGFFYEQWLYTFWYRRYLHGTMDDIFNILKISEYLLYPINKHEASSKIAWSKNNLDHIKVDLSEQLEQYNTALIARKNKDKLAVWTDKALTLKAPLILYSQNRDKQNAAYKYINQGTSLLKDSTTPHSYYNYSPDITHNSVDTALYMGIQFLSLTESMSLSTPFKEVKASNTETTNINSLMTEKYGNPWVFESCNNHQLQKFTGVKYNVFTLSNSCQVWRGEGSSGPSALVVFYSSKDGDIEQSHTFINYHSSISIDKSNLRDINDNRQIELIISHSQGLSTDHKLVELDGNNWKLIRKISTYSEGGYEDYHETKLNRLIITAE